MGPVAAVRTALARGPRFSGRVGRAEVCRSTRAIRPVPGPNLPGANLLGQNLLGLDLPGQGLVSSGLLGLVVPGAAGVAEPSHMRRGALPGPVGSAAIRAFLIAFSGLPHVAATVPRHAAGRSGLRRLLPVAMPCAGLLAFLLLVAPAGDALAGMAAPGVHLLTGSIALLLAASLVLLIPCARPPRRASARSSSPLQPA